MITSISIGDQGHTREKVIKYIKNRIGNDGSKTVIDIGGAAAEWSREVATHYIDIRKVDVGQKVLFQLDLCDGDGWTQVENYVKQNGKFDFCICTHTLEDVLNPAYVCKKISQIAKEGVISFPSKYKELHRHEHSISPDFGGNELGNEFDQRFLDLHRGNFYRGYGHHYWYMSIDTDGNFYALPKCGIIEVDSFYDPMGFNDPEISEVCFTWENEIKCWAINGAVYFNSIQHCISAYREAILNDAIDKAVGFHWTVVSGKPPPTEKNPLLPSVDSLYGDYYVVLDPDRSIERFLTTQGRMPGTNDMDELNEIRRNQK